MTSGREVVKFKEESFLCPVRCLILEFSWRDRSKPPNALNI